jgi:glycosyltransferase involved in cell wall biosynthesis
MGVQPHEKVLEHVRRAALCVFPSYAEAFPIAWLEAMACAKPIIAYDIGWASEIVETGVNGILIKLGDVEALAQSMISLLENPVERYALGAAARKRVELEFTSQLVASQTLEYYQHVLAR